MIDLNTCRKGDSLKAQDGTPFSYHQKSAINNEHWVERNDGRMGLRNADGSVPAGSPAIKSQEIIAIL